MTMSKQDLLKILGITDKETDVPIKPVNPQAEKVINGLERLLEELEKEEEQEKGE